MIKEYGNTLHIKLDKLTLSCIKDGYWSHEWGCMEFLAANADSCDFDDVDNAIIINERFVIEEDDMDDSFDVLASGRVLIVPECDHMADYAEWWK